MDAIYDQRAAAAGDDPHVELAAAAGTPPLDVEDRAPITAFAGRDDQATIDELAAELRAADAAMVRQLRGIVTDRMDRGDLSSVAAMRLYQLANRRLGELRGVKP